MKRFRKKLRKRFGSKDYNEAGEMTEIFRKAIREDLRPILGRVTVPVLLVWGALDTETPIADGKLMEKTMPNAQMVVFEDGTHFVFWEHAKEVAEYVAEFAG